MQCKNDYLYCVRGNGLSQRFYLFVLSFFFFSIESNVKIFVKDCSGTITARSLKLGILCYDGDLCCVSDKGLSWLICSSVPSFLFLSILDNVTFFHNNNCLGVKLSSLDRDLFNSPQ